MTDELATIAYLREQVRSISKLASDARQERDQAREENQRLQEELKGFKDDDGVSGTPEGDYFWNVMHLQADLAAARAEVERLRRREENAGKLERAGLDLIDEKEAEVDQARDLAARAAEEAARLRGALESIESGILPDGDHVSVSVAMYARAALAREDGDG